jgi:hypothetical protein
MPTHFWTQQRAPHPLAVWFAGWPMLVAIWAAFGLLMWRLATLGGEPIQRSDDDLVDMRWFSALLPLFCAPAVVLFAYVNWLGWQFFRHN